MSTFLEQLRQQNMERAMRSLQFDNGAQVSRISEAFIEKYKNAEKGQKPSLETQKVLKDLEKYPQAFNNSSPNNWINVPSASQASMEGMDEEELRVLLQRHRGRAEKFW